MRVKLSPSQFQALEDVELKGDPYYRVRGMSQYGGWTKVMHFLEYKMKFIRYDPHVRPRPGRWILTDAGFKALLEERLRRRVSVAYVPLKELRRRACLRALNPQRARVRKKKRA